MQTGEGPEAGEAAEAGRWTSRNRQLEPLMALARGGDAAAFAALYDASAGWLLAVVRRIVDDGQAEDVLADTYFQIWHSLPHFDALRAPPAIWMAVIARSRALDHLRRERSRRKVTDEVNALAEQVAHGPEELLSQSQQARLLHSSLMHLDSTERLVVGLAYFRDCSYPDIARLTGIPLARVRSCMAGAQRKLRAQMMVPGPVTVAGPVTPGPA